ncbi:MAG: polysaccharide biosynthesis protein [Clostridia bacterium]|nr:polysaccharide biosynthesis protein [Clostridia bacterium]
MRKGKEKKQVVKESFMQGVFAMMFSQVLIKLIGLVYKLYLTNREGFGDEGNGIYSAGFYIYSLLLTLSSVGVPNAISKLVSERIALGDNKGANRIFKIAFATFGLLGFMGTCILFFGAHYISNFIIQIPEAELTLVALSPSIFFVSLICVIRGYFNGNGTLKVTANSQTLEQIFKATFTILLVEIVAITMGLNTTIMAAGANLATTVATIGSFIYLFVFYKNNRTLNVNQTGIITKKESIIKVIRNILYVSVPISLSAILSSINKNIDSTTVVRGLKNFMDEGAAKIQYGILSGKVDTLTSLPLSFNIAFATALVPALSYARAKNDMSTANKRVSFSVLVTILIGLPCSVGMFVYAEPILKLLFPAQSAGTFLLQISSLSIIFTVLAQTINGALQGLGKVMVPAIAFGVGVIAKLIINIALIPIPQIGVNGAAIGTIICNLIACIIGFSVLKKNMNIQFKFSKYIIKPILATFIMAICSYAIYIILLKFIPLRISAIIAMVLAVIIYAFATISLKIFTKEEIHMIPYGQKIYKILEKIGIYNEKSAI